MVACGSKVAAREICSWRLWYVILLTVKYDNHNQSCLQVMNCGGAMICVTPLQCRMIHTDVPCLALMSCTLGTIPLLLCGACGEDFRSYRASLPVALVERFWM